MHNWPTVLTAVQHTYSSRTLFSTWSAAAQPGRMNTIAQGSLNTVTLSMSSLGPPVSLYRAERHSNALIYDLGSYPALRRLETKSLSVVTSDPNRMLRYIPLNGSPSPVDVIHVDITKTSSGCLQPVYAPIIAGAPPSSYREPYCAWLSSIPPRLKQHMYHTHVWLGLLHNTKFTDGYFNTCITLH